MAGGDALPARRLRPGAGVVERGKGGRFGGQPHAPASGLQQGGSRDAARSGGGARRAAGLHSSGRATERVLSTQTPEAGGAGRMKDGSFSVEHLLLALAGGVGRDRRWVGGDGVYAPRRPHQGDTLAWEGRRRRCSGGQGRWDQPARRARNGIAREVRNGVSRALGRSRPSSTRSSDATRRFRAVLISLSRRTRTTGADRPPGASAKTAKIRSRGLAPAHRERRTSTRGCGHKRTWALDMGAARRLPRQKSSRGEFQRERLKGPCFKGRTRTAAGPDASVHRRAAHRGRGRPPAEGAMGTRAIC